MATTFRAKSALATGSTSVTISKPTGTAENDILFAQFGRYSYSTCTSTPEGWTLVQYQAIGTTREQYVYYKVATASEPSGYTWTFSSGTSTAAMIYAFYGGFNTTDPIDVVGTGTYMLTNTTQLAYSIDPTEIAETALWFAYAYGSSVTTSTISGWSEIQDGGTLPNYIDCQYRELASAEPTGNVSATLSTSITLKTAFMVALNPESGTQHQIALEAVASVSLPPRGGA